MHKKKYFHQDRLNVVQPSSFANSELKNDLLRQKVEIVKKQASPSEGKVESKL
jgi:hypothetical protein